MVLWCGCARDTAKRDYDRLEAEFRRGDLVQVAASAQQHAAKLADQPRWQWEYRLLAAESLTLLSRYDEAGKIVAEDPPENLPAERVRAWIDRAQLRFPKSAEAAELLHRARAQASTPEQEIRVDLVEGNLEAYQGHPARAEELYCAALAVATKIGDLHYQANALNNISVARRRLNRYEDSVDYAQRALTVAESGKALRMAAAAHGSLGTSYAYLGQFEAALEHERQSIRMDEQMGQREFAMYAIGELGGIYHRMERFGEAIEPYRHAFALATELGKMREAARFAQNTSEALSRSGKWDAAQEWNTRAADLAQQSGAKSTLPYLMLTRAELARARGRSVEAAELAREILQAHAGQRTVEWGAHHLLALIYTADHRYRDANREFEAALADIEASRSDVVDSQYRVTLLSRLIDFYRGYVDSLVTQGADLKALAIAESSRARVLAERLGRDVEPARYADAAVLRTAARASGASVLAFWVAPQRSFAWIVTPATVRRVDLPPAAEIEALVTAYRGAVEHSIADPLEEPAGHALWEKIVAPVAHEIPKGSRVVVVPDGPLHRLNLETLAAPGPQPHYWIEDVELAVAPSVAMALAPTASQPAAGSLLLIGAPDYAGVGYQPLPGAAAEVDELRKRFSDGSPAVITGKNASPAAYRAADPGRYSLIHFAAHAEANSEKPLESAVVLSRAGDSFKLYANDVIDVPIHADLVTLSGCRSAGARAYAGEGLMGFAWAFLRAGAHAVVAGLWDVSDGVTAPLMAHFYDGVLARQSPAAALRAAKLQLLQEGRYRKAFYWGAFQTYIGGGAAH